MKLRTLDAPLNTLETEAVVIFRHEGGPAGEAFSTVDARTGGVVGAVTAAGDFRGKAAEVLVIQTPGAPIRRVAVAGLGKPGGATLETVREAAGKAASMLRDLGVPALVVAPPAPADIAWKPGLAVPSAEALAQAAAEGARLALYKLDLYKQKKDDARAVAEIGVVPPGGAATAEVARGVETAAVLADAIDAARTLILHPGNVLTPSRLAEEAQAIGREAGVAVEVMTEAGLTERGFAGIMAIARGSENPPRLITMRWNGGKAGEAPIAIVGKGVTFDTGGIGIKPPAGMEKMKYDMAGGAATIAILAAAARLKLPINLVGVVPAVENMPGATALVPNEIVTMYGGLTVEINNTDAEGRLILADALAYAVKDLGAAALIDMATLTGAVGVALGRNCCGVMGNHQGLVEAVLQAGDRAGEQGWQLPLLDEYDEATKSDLADLKNYAGRDAGASTAAAFLKPFVFGKPWVHLDIAGVGWSDSDRGYRPKGPTGTPVRTLIELLRAWQPLG